MIIARRLFGVRDRLANLKNHQDFRLAYLPPTYGYSTFPFLTAFEDAANVLARKLNTRPVRVLFTLHLAEEFQPNSCLVAYSDVKELASYRIATVRRDSNEPSFGVLFTDFRGFPTTYLPCVSTCPKYFLSDADRHSYIAHRASYFHDRTNYRWAQLNISIAREDLLWSFGERK